MKKLPFKMLSNVVCAACVVFLIQNPVAARQTDIQPSATSKDEKSPPPASLDDLLGLDEEEQDTSGNDAASKDADEELKRKLNEADITDSFALAVEKMAISAELLDVRFDPGLGTQRVQEEIIAKLEHLIDQAKKQQSQSQSSSSSSSSSQQSRDQKQNPGQQPSQQKPDSGNQQDNSPSDSQEGDLPALEQGDVNVMLEESRSEWGHLPPRVRDQLLQGRREKFSSLYEQLTQEYYKRLAEEGTP